MPSTAWICDKKAFPSPAPSEAPLMSPAMSVTSNWPGPSKEAQVTQPLEPLIGHGACARSAMYRTGSSAAAPAPSCYGRFDVGQAHDAHLQVVLTRPHFEAGLAGLVDLAFTFAWAASCVVWLAASARSYPACRHDTSCNELCCSSTAYGLHYQVDWSGAALATSIDVSTARFARHPSVYTPPACCGSSHVALADPTRAAWWCGAWLSRPPAIGFEWGSPKLSPGPLRCLMGLLVHCAAQN